MKESLIKYLAGLLDADGNLTFRYTEDKRRPGMFFVGLALNLGSASSIDRHGFVASLPTITGLGTVNSPNSYSGKGQYVNWNVCHRNELEKLLPRLVKHMVVKGKHWDWTYKIWQDIRHKGYGRQAVSITEREALEQARKESRKLNVGPLKPKNFPTWAWLAGYMDGDGYFVHRDPSKKRYGMWMGACAHITDVSVLEFLYKAFGGKITEHSKSQNVMEWERSLSNANRSFALRFLPKIVKHSRLKRHKIELMIHHHQQRLSVQSSTE